MVKDLHLNRPAGGRKDASRCGNGRALDDRDLTL